MADAPRSTEQRIADTRRILETAEDVWVASAAGDRAHLVPLTFDWVDGAVVVVTDRSSVTARNIVDSGRARLAFGGLRDVVMADAELAHTTAGSDADELAAHYVRRHHVDPRTWGDDYVFLVLRPTRIQAWREADEITGRTIMRDGTWLT